jgi:hypothetical protein
MWRVFRKRLHLKAIHRQGVERWIVCTPISINVFVTLAHSNIWNTFVKLILKHPVHTDLCLLSFSLQMLGNM